MSPSDLLAEDQEIREHFALYPYAGFWILAYHRWETEYLAKATAWLRAHGADPLRAQDDEQWISARRALLAGDETWRLTPQPQQGRLAL